MMTILPLQSYRHCRAGEIKRKFVGCLSIPPSQLVVLLLVALVLSGCCQPVSIVQVPATPRPDQAMATGLPPTALPVPITSGLPATAVPTPVPEVTAVSDLLLPAGVVPEDWVGYHSQGSRFSLFLPPQWEMVDLTGENVEARLARLEERLDDEDLRSVLAQFLATGGMAAAVVLLVDEAVLQGGRYVPNILLIPVPAKDITLYVYAELVGQQLEEHGLSTLLQSGVVYGWRSQGMPVALVDYLLDGAAYDLAGLEIRGQQIAFYDTSGEWLLIITFTAPSSRFDELQPVFHQIAGSIVFL
jgi:hypothetical protein